MARQKKVRYDSVDEIDKNYHGYIFHYYRAEVYRQTNWRTRLDTTTNWAIVVTAAILSYSFSTPESSHAIILLNYLAVLFFLNIESRRYRYYNILKYRVRLLEQYVLAEIFEKKKPVGSIGWRSRLADSLRVPRITMSRIESIAWRVRRNYIFLISVTMLAWIGKLMDTGLPPATLAEFIGRASVGPIPGFLIFDSVTASVGWFCLIAYFIPKRSFINDLP